MHKNTLTIKGLLGILLIFLFASCENDQPLPILGEKEVIDGVEVAHSIPDFSFLNQDSIVVTNEDLNSGIYVADFFFTHCPSICPLVTKEMLRIHDEFKNENVKLVSFTMDPKRDTPAQLKNYSSKLEVEAPKWHFLTGDKDKLHDIATDYFSVVIEDGDAPGGFNHTGKLLLIDKNRHIRAFCEGTDSEDVDDFILDIKKLLAENEE
ncbi:SCO family protein [Portibacter lacus]|uniref:Photosynthetic protein synthase II n=1 Tax=Portibacter lacus TaxID=1099794 RepID=A0AA37SRF4_9BACT|nr:SCO family protein [Portibacter lacus]GLR17406.1 photosynthetic protein synthase II [Portibacter lacus]